MTLNNEVRCPFCGAELHCGAALDVNGKIMDILYCSNWNCPSGDLIGSRAMWRGLNLAIEGLHNCKTREHIGAICRTPEYVDSIIEQIKVFTNDPD